MKTVKVLALEPGTRLLEVPRGARVLSLQFQGDVPRVVVLCDTEQPLVCRFVWNIAADEEILPSKDGDPDMPEYVGSYARPTGGWSSQLRHVFLYAEMPLTG